MSKHYNQSYNSEEIKVILDRIKDLIENSCNEFVVVISFHRINKPVSYLFK